MELGLVTCSLGRSWCLSRTAGGSRTGTSGVRARGGRSRAGTSGRRVGGVRHVVPHEMLAREEELDGVHWLGEELVD